MLSAWPRRLRWLATVTFLAVPARAQFTDATFPPLDNLAAADGISWGDYDADGDHDLFVGNKTANRLFRNDGLSFVDVATPLLADSTTHTRGVPWGDYDNDGDLDIYICNKQANRLCRNDAGTFSDATAPPLDDAASTRSAAWADYDADGDLDLYIANENAANRLFRNDPGAFVDVATGPVADPSATTSIVWGDFDNDGDPDLYVCNTGSSNKLLRNDGGAFTNATTGPLGYDGNGRGVDAGDYDNDGDLDLYFSNDAEPNKLLRNDGDNTWKDATAVPLGDPAQGQGVAWADYDNDGDLDLYLSNWTTPNKLFRNDGGSFADVTVPPLDDPGPGKGVAWCDYDDDGDLDLYLANSGLTNRLFRNDTSGNHWLHVDLVGTVSNRAAIGARVRIVTAAGQQIREVSGGYGVGSQGSLTVEFGLGAETVVDSLIIGWPCGARQVLTALPVDQRLRVIEGDPTAAPSPAATAGSFLLLTSRPNPFDGWTTICFELPSRSLIDLAVFDLRGVRVQDLARGERGPGAHDCSWDGRDAAGRPVPAGVYLYRLRTEHGDRTGKVVYLR